MSNFIILNVTYNHKLYNFFDTIKSKLAFKENIPFYNLYNGIKQDFILQNTDYFFTNKPYSNLNNFNPANYEVKHIHEMFQKFYFFIRENKKELNNYDFILRCNSSTFLNFKTIKQIIQQLPKTNCYAGVQLNRILVSGTCIFFSKDVLFKIADTDLQSISFENNYDDVTIGNLISDTYKIPPTHIPQYNFSSGNIPSDDEIKQSLLYPTIRVRNNNDREKIDVFIWNKLFKFYQSSYLHLQS